jgi:hypothetical protein
MQTKYLIHRIEIVERILPVYYLLFVVKMLVFGPAVTKPYAAAQVLPGEMWLLVFLCVGIFQALATELYDEPKSLVLLMPVNRLREYLPRKVCAGFRVVMLAICFIIWTTWAFGLFSFPEGFGGIIWTLNGIAVFWAFCRSYNSPVKK